MAQRKRYYEVFKSKYIRQSLGKSSYIRRLIDKLSDDASSDNRLTQDDAARSQMLRMFSQKNSCFLTHEIITSSTVKAAIKEREDLPIAKHKHRKRHPVQCDCRESEHEFIEMGILIDDDDTLYPPPCAQIPPCMGCTFPLSCEKETARSIIVNIFFQSAPRRRLLRNVVSCFYPCRAAGCFQYSDYKPATILTMNPYHYDDYSHSHNSDYMLYHHTDYRSYHYDDYDLQSPY